MFSKLASQISIFENGLSKLGAFLWKHLDYAAYVARHKYFVFLEGRRLGLSPLMLAVHDWDKFLIPEMWLAYANHFGGRKGSGTGYIKADDVGDVRFDNAVAAHCRRNKHHWEHWVLQTQDLTLGTVLKKHIRPMPDKFRKEMLADWRGAGRAQGKPDVQAWYLANKDRILLDRESKIRVSAKTRASPQGLALVLPLKIFGGAVVSVTKFVRISPAVNANVITTACRAADT